MRRSALFVPTVAVAGLALLAGCSGGGDSCIEGSWQPAGMSELSDEAGGSLDFTLKFDGDAISVDSTSSVPASDGAEAMEIAITYTGKYSVSDDKITITGMTGSTTINGEKQPDSGGFGMEEGEREFSCSGDKLTIADEDFTKK